MDKSGILVICIIIIVAMVSFFSGTLVASKNIQGIWSRDSFGFSGEWIHINIDDMSFNRALEVCRHEVGHGIYAKYCQQSDYNFNKCAKLADLGYGYGEK